MKLNISHNNLSEIVNGNILQSTLGSIDIVIYDSRKIATTRKGVFFALKGSQRDGHYYCKDAYDKGVRCFIVSQNTSLPDDAHIIKVENTLAAFQLLAKYHRNKFSIPFIAITGSFGKTTLKEWLYFLLKDHYTICRTPKSYNSQIGVAHSLLELNEKHELAIIEADISHPEEMEKLEEIISPTLGVFTGLGSHYLENFKDQEHHLGEHLKLFTHTNFTFILDKYASPFRRKKINTIITSVNEWKALLAEKEQFPEIKALCLKVAVFLGVKEEVLKTHIYDLPVLSGRQEVFEGINGNLIINDSYNIDIDALEQALEYQFSSREREEKVVVLDLNYVNDYRKKEILQLVNRYHPDNIIVIENDVVPEELKSIRNTSILFKGSFNSNLNKIVQQFKNRKHETRISFDLKAIHYNLNYLRGLANENTLTLVMVKASSYGTGDIQIPHFLQENGVNYLGVAYADEGATLRENGILLPIIVMNSEESAFEDIIRLELEPAVYTMQQLRAFYTVVRDKNMNNYPIHLKFETGMNRLGFDQENINEIFHFLSNNTCLKVKSVFSHLADAGNDDTTFSKQQIHRFKEIRKEILSKVESPVLFHLLNSDGILKFAALASFDMVRIGIGLFGYTSQSAALKPSVKWMTSISQVKSLDKGETVGYNRAFKADEPVKIATIRVGYADGFRRLLSNGVGRVFIKGVACPVVGNVCMDMTMVDVTGVECNTGDEVEIIGKHQTMEAFAKQLNTIPYEVMTSISKRVARVYVKE